MESICLSCTPLFLRLCGWQKSARRTKSIFRHEPSGKAAEAYRGLVKEVLEIGENSVADLLSVDSLFTTQAERDEARRETVRDIPLEEISDFPNHPFKVRMDESMMEMTDSVKQYGVLVPRLGSSKTKWRL